MIFKATPNGFFIPDQNGPGQEGAFPGNFPGAMLPCAIFPCALGKSGLVKDKREGDQASPIGIWKILYILYRADKIPAPKCHFPLQAIEKNDGWCDEPDHRQYNQKIKLPFAASHEELWRKDHLYDIIVVLDHNQNPTIPHKGSAIFLHIAREVCDREVSNPENPHQKNYEKTAGCVALSQPHLEQVLSLAKPGDAIEICAG